MRASSGGAVLELLDAQSGATGGALVGELGANLVELDLGVLVGRVELDRLLILEQSTLAGAGLVQLLGALEVLLRGADLRAQQPGAEVDVVRLAVQQLEIEDDDAVPVALLLRELRLPMHPVRRAPGQPHEEADHQ